jgi:hypothetical protein
MAKIKNLACGLAVVIVFVALSIFIFLGWTLDAEAQDSFSRMGMGGPARLIEQFDANEDGAVTQKEIDEARTQNFKQYDSNNDGTLSLEEFEPLWREQSRPRMVDRFQAFDNDGSGNVTPEEFNPPTANLVRRLDKNNDGKVTLDEMGPPRRGPFRRGRR